MMNVLMIAGFSFFSPHSSFDSLGVQQIDGMLFVIHKVDEKETLYGISRRYGTTVDAILKYNPSAEAGLEIGLILKVPYTKSNASKGGKGAMHTVSDKETLYSISRQYDVSVDDLKKWNGLTSNELAVGQQLIIKQGSSVISENGSSTIAPTSSVKGGSTHTVAPKETLYSISRQYDVSVDEIRSWNSLSGNELKIGQVLVVSSGAASKPGNENVEKVETVPPKTEIKQPPVVVNEPVKTEKQVSTEPPVTRQVTISESVRDGDEVVQGGLAELIEGTEANRKYLALHRTAPKGTILKVRNELNNREVFVRVMGKLPDTAVNDKLIIKISKSAFDRLGAIDKQFRVEVTYYE